MPAFGGTDDRSRDKWQVNPGGIWGPDFYKSLAMKGNVDKIWAAAGGLAS